MIFGSGNFWQIWRIVSDQNFTCHFSHISFKRIKQALIWILFMVQGICQFFNSQYLKNHFINTNTASCSWNNNYVNFNMSLNLLTINAGHEIKTIKCSDMSAQDKICSDIYPRWSDISRNIYCSVTCWLGHLSNQTGICIAQNLKVLMWSAVVMLG